MKNGISFIVLAVVITFGVSVSHAQYEPESGSAERQAIMDALRAGFKREIRSNKPVIFRVSSLRVKNGWAILSAGPLKPDGSSFNYSGTRYESDWRSGDFEDSVQALLKKTGAVWRVLVISVNATDYVMNEECRKRRCPAELR